MASLASAWTSAIEHRRHGDNELKGVQKELDIKDGEDNEETVTTSVQNQTQTRNQNRTNIDNPKFSAIPRFTHFQDLFELVTGLLLPYIFHPLLAIEIFFPGLATMWPFDISTSFDPAKDLTDLKGKVVLVTGGNTGIGKETVLQLAKHHPQKIFLAARTESKGRDAIASIKSQTPQDVDIEYLPLDLASLPSVKNAAEQVTKSADRLDILILNAGIMAVPAGKTAAGQDIQLGTNHVGHFLLTKLLLPTLQRTAKELNPDVRVVSVSSEAWNLAPNLDTILSTEKLTAQSPWTRYAASKAANIMFAAELARRYPSLTSVSVHPGLIKTDLYIPNTKSNPIMRYGSMIIGPLIFQNTQAGALNQLWVAAGSKKEQLQNGGYYTPVAKFHKNKWATDANAGKKLWEWTEKELTTAGY
jgi:NAD(P)-dependent dehydrogenase (short-subunit alcohol dehydrogenase family)